MARTATYEEQEIQEAIRLVESAKTIQQLRQGQAILIPALTGASMEATARMVLADSTSRIASWISCSSYVAVRAMAPPWEGFTAQCYISTSLIAK